jgi:hypothetical protein
MNIIYILIAIIGFCGIPSQPLAGIAMIIIGIGLLNQNRKKQALEKRVAKLEEELLKKNE